MTISISVIPHKRYGKSEFSSLMCFSSCDFKISSRVLQGAKREALPTPIASAKQTQTHTHTYTHHIKKFFHQMNGKKSIVDKVPREEMKQMFLSVKIKKKKKKNSIKITA